MFINAPRFPASIARGAVGGPRFLTEVVGTQGGAEQRNQKWRSALGEYEIGLVNKDEMLTRELFAFFRAVARGKQNTFRFRDFLPGEAHLERERFAFTDGILTSYPLLRIYASGAETYVRYITKPVLGTIRFWVEDIEQEQSSFTVDTLTGLVTPANLLTAGLNLYCSCDYDVEVRFNVDKLPIRQIDRRTFSWESITLMEVR
jgi:uncharacterized protein (TIGR02217 family)